MLFVLHRYDTKRPAIAEHMGVKIPPSLRACSPEFPKHLEESLTEKMKDQVLVIPVTLKKEVIVEEPSAPRVQKETNQISKVR